MRRPHVVADVGVIVEGVASTTALEPPGSHELVVKVGAEMSSKTNWVVLDESDWNQLSKIKSPFGSIKDRIFYLG